MISNFGGLPQAPVSTPPVADGPAQRLSPRPRVTQAVTTADPVLTKFALGRSNDGSQFGMFVQIFADGTVVDSEGVHRVRSADLRPVVEAVQSGELYRLRGHCGAPSTDFIEYIHIVIYERRLGRLNAHAFSYSGNMQGCDQSIRRLHTALESLQGKLSRQGATSSSPAAVPAPLTTSPLPQPGLSSATPLAPPLVGPRSTAPPSAPDVNPDPSAVIPLTPLEPPH
jgi:hypothetical protein